MNKLRWGVLGAAKIALQKVIPALQRSQHCQVLGIASRTKEKAVAAAAQLGVARSYGSYQELLDDAGIDVVYNPLPNHLHVPWSVAALQAGKHVLCEKPIALTAAGAETLVAESRRHPHLKIMEAFMYRGHPQWIAAKEMVDRGEIGKLMAISSLFSYFNRDPNNVRNQREIGGGALVDIGCYPISLSRFMFGSEPLRVLGSVQRDPQWGIDRLTSGILEFAEGVSIFACGTQMSPYQRVQILGASGRIEIEIPFNAPPDRPCKLWLQQGNATEEIVLETADQYTIQGDRLSLAIINDTPVPTPPADAVANMRVIEAVLASAAK